MAAGIIMMLAVSAYMVRAESVAGRYPSVFESDTLSKTDTLPSSDSLSSPDSLSVTDSLAVSDSLPGLDSLSAAAVDSLSVADSLLATDTLSAAVTDSLFASDTLAGLDSLATPMDPKELEDSLRYAERMRKKYIRDSLKAERDSIRWAKPRVLETGFLPDSMYYDRIVSWTTGPYINEYTPARIDTTYNDWYSEYPFYKEDVDVTYLGTVGSATQNVNFLKRREFDKFTAFAPYLTYSYTPETMPFYNTKTPYTELAYWGTLFSVKTKEELNVKFMHMQNITPAFNLAFMVQHYGAAGWMNREETTNNTVTITGNYIGKKYSASGGYIRQKVIRQENGGMQDSFYVRDTTVDAKTIPINLEEADNELVRNTFFITHSYNISLRSKNKQKADTAFVSDLLPATDSTAAQDSSLVSTPPVESVTTSGFGVQPAGSGNPGMPPPGGIAPPVTDSTGTPDSTFVEALGDGPIISVGHIGEVSTFSRVYTDNISLTDEAGRNFYNNAFYINPTTSFDSTRVFSVENKLYFKLQPWAREAVISNISGGLGHKWNSVYGFDPEMFFTGNQNVHLHDLYVYAGLGGQFRKYMQWGANARYSFLGYYQNDFDFDAHLGFSIYPFKDKSQPITLKGRFESSLTEPDWYSQKYYSNHYMWNNNFGKTSKTKIEATLEIPKWQLEASFGYALVNNYLYHDTLGVIRQHDGLINVMTAYVKKNFKVWLLRFDNQVLFQYSSDKNVLPLPMLTFRVRYYLEFPAVKNVLTVQLGANATFNTLYYAPAYNPALGAFQLQTEELIGNNPYIDVFLNMQWKTVSIFLKVINVGQGWPNGDMLATYQYVKPYRTFKIGIHWPFYFK